MGSRTQGEELIFVEREEHPSSYQEAEADLWRRRGIPRVYPMGWRQDWAEELTVAKSGKINGDLRGSGYGGKLEDRTKITCVEMFGSRG